MVEKKVCVSDIHKNQDWQGLGWKSFSIHPLDKTHHARFQGGSMRPLRLMWPRGHTRAQPKTSPSCPLQPALPFLICQAPPTSGPSHLLFPWPGTASPYGYSQGSLPSGLRSDVAFLNQVSQISVPFPASSLAFADFASHSTCLHLLDPHLSLTVRSVRQAGVSFHSLVKVKSLCP